MFYYVVFILSSKAACIFLLYSETSSTLFRHHLFYSVTPPVWIIVIEFRGIDSSARSFFIWQLGVCSKLLLSLFCTRLFSSEFSIFFSFFYRKFALRFRVTQSQLSVFKWLPLSIFFKLGKFRCVPRQTEAQLWAFFSF